MKSAKPQHFFEQARTAFRVAGSEGRQCVLLINVGLERSFMGMGGEQARMDFTTVKKTHKSIRLSR